jgi:hypothetical protein
MLNFKTVSRFVAQGAGGHYDDPAVASQPHELTLRRQGLIGFVVLVAYVVFAGLLIAQQREALLRIVQDLEAVYARDDALTRASSSLAYAVLAVNEAYAQALVTPRADTIAVDVEAVQAGLQGLSADYPQLSRFLVQLGANVAALRAQPARATLLELRDNLHALVGALDGLTRGVRDRRKSLSDGYRVGYDSMAVIALSLGLAGVILFGGLTALFFTRLAWDLNTLEARAREVVRGYRGEPLRVTRRDEVGGLMQAVNQMQSDLRSREQQLEVVR